MTIVAIIVNRDQDRVLVQSQGIAIMISIIMTTMMPLTTILVMKTAVLMTEPMRMTIWSLKIDLIQQLILPNKLFLYEKKE